MEMPMYLQILVVCIGLMGLGLTFWLLYSITRSKIRDVQSNCLVKRADGGISVPLIAAFGGWKSIPWIASTSSNIAPLLVLHESEIEFRIIRLKRRPYADVSKVDVRTALATVNIVLEFRTSIWTFSGNTASRPNAAAALAILQEKGCPLSERARSLLDNMEAEVK